MKDKELTGYYGQLYI